MQVVPRGWPADAVHDTVEAVVSTRAFRHSLRNSIGERLLLWLGQGIDWLMHALHGLPGARTMALWSAGALALLFALRLVIAAQARDPDASIRVRRRERGSREDPWRAAERLAAAGDFEGAAHAMYRGVLEGLAAGGRVRLDPSKTSGDYARELRRRGSPLWQEFRGFARRFDTAVYGRGVCDAGLLDDLRRLALPLRAGSARAA